MSCPKIMKRVRAGLINLGLKPAKAPKSSRRRRRRKRKTIKNQRGGGYDNNTLTPHNIKGRGPKPVRAQSLDKFNRVKPDIYASATNSKTKAISSLPFSWQDTLTREAHLKSKPYDRDLLIAKYKASAAVTRTQLPIPWLPLDSQNITLRNYTRQTD